MIDIPPNPYATSRNKPVWFEGPSPCDIMLIGEAPGCLPPGELVWSEYDAKPIEDYKTGEVVRSRTGLSRVLKTFSRPYKGKLIKVMAHGSRTFRLTPQHRVLVRRYTTCNHAADYKKHCTPNCWHHRKLVHGCRLRTFHEAPMAWVAASSLGEHDHVILPKLRLNVDWMWDEPTYKGKCDRRLYHDDEHFYYVPIRKVETEWYDGIVHNLETEDNSYNVPFVIHNSIEDAYGRPFIGESGTILRQICIMAGRPAEQMRIGNVVPYRPPNNRTPTEDEIAPFVGCLHEEIEQSQPKVVVLLGEVPMHTVLGKTGVMAHRGTLFTHPAHNDVVFIVTPHPAYALRELSKTRKEEEGTTDWLEVMRLDLVKAVSVCNEGVPQKPSTTYKNATTLKQIQQYCEQLSTFPVLAVDLETTGLDALTDDVLCIGFSPFAHIAYVIPLRGEHGKPIWRDAEFAQIIQWLKLPLEGPPKLIGQKIKFDDLFVRSLGLRMTNIALDLMIAHDLVNENLPHNLDFLVSVYTDMPQYSLDIKSYLSAGGYTDAPVGVLWLYQARDVDATMRIAAPLLEDVGREGVDKLLPHAMQLNTVITDMQAKGIRIDVDKLVPITKRKLELLAQAEYELDQLVAHTSTAQEQRAKGKQFNPRSPTQVRKLLFDEWKLRYARKTAAGNKSTDEETVTTLLEQRVTKLQADFLNRLLSIRGEGKLVSTFLAGRDLKSGILRHMRADGRIHPSFSQTTTVTGRLACSKPNLQNIVKQEDIDDKSQRVRALYVPAHGYVFVRADYSQVELRVAAVEADDTVLKVLLRKDDVHIEVARLVFAKQEISAAERDKAKAFTFGVLYGRSAESIARKLRIAVDEAVDLRTRIFDLLKGVDAYYQRIDCQLDADGWVVNAFGRKRRFQLQVAVLKLLQRALRARWDDSPYSVKWEHIRRQAINTPIQGDAAEVIRRALVRIHRRIDTDRLDAAIVNQVHDELIIEVAEHDAARCVQVLREEMVRPVPELDNQSFPIELEVGRFWGDSSLTDRYAT